MRVEVGDCVEVMAAMPGASVDAVVCDPPYGLEFMGKEWDRLGGFGWESSIGATGYTDGDRLARPSYGSTRNPMCRGCRKHQRGRDRCACEAPDFDQRPGDANRRMQEWHEAWAREALRVLKPGGHLLAFGGTRTYHRLTCAIEDAGFEVRDCLAWLYGSGFPKSLDVGKAIDKAAGAEREVVGHNPKWNTGPRAMTPGGGEREAQAAYTAPATPEAQAWDGWGTALKPAHEPIVVARKPLAGTVAGNVLAHGTGALNVDGCRIGTDPTLRERTPEDFGLVNDDGWEPTPGVNGSPAGRWPANVLLDGEAADLLDQQTGERRSAGEYTKGSRGFHPDTGKRGSAPFGVDGLTSATYDDEGGASRFFYVAKADTAERNAGLGDVTSLFAPADAPERNDHPTVKPIDLMRWLVRLVTPPGGTVLDPFCGSGTTGCAAALEGFDFIGIEREDAYAAIARARIAHWGLGAEFAPRTHGPSDPVPEEAA